LGLVMEKQEEVLEALKIKAEDIRSRLFAISNEQNLKWQDLLSQYSVLSTQFFTLIQELDPFMNHWVLYPKTPHPDPNYLPGLLSTKSLPEAETENESHWQKFLALNNISDNQFDTKHIDALKERVELYNTFVQELNKIVSDACKEKSKVPPTTTTTSVTSKLPPNQIYPSLISAVSFGQGLRAEGKVTPTTMTSSMTTPSTITSSSYSQIPVRSSSYSSQPYSFPYQQQQQQQQQQQPQQPHHLPNVNVSGNVSAMNPVTSTLPSASSQKVFKNGGTTPSQLLTRALTPSQQPQQPQSQQSQQQQQQQQQPQQSFQYLPNQVKPIYPPQSHPPPQPQSSQMSKQFQLQQLQQQLQTNAPKPIFHPP